MSENLDEHIAWLEEKMQSDASSLLFARLAQAYLESGRVDEAVSLCIAGVKEYPDYTTAHLLLGRCYIALKKFPDAKRALQQVLDLLPTCARADALLRDIAVAEERPVVKPPSLAKRERKRSRSDVIPGVEEIVSPPSPKRSRATRQASAEKPSIPAEQVTAKELEETGKDVEGDAELEQLIRSLKGAKIPPLSETDVLEPLVEEPEEKTQPPPIITETLASIYTDQGGYEEAIAAYKVLMQQRPEEKEKFEKKIQDLQGKIKERDERGKKEG